MGNTSGFVGDLRHSPGNWVGCRDSARLSAHNMATPTTFWYILLYDSSSTRLKLFFPLLVFAFPYMCDFRSVLSILYVGKYGFFPKKHTLVDKGFKVSRSLNISLLGGCQGVLAMLYSSAFWIFHYGPMCCYAKKTFELRGSVGIISWLNFILSIIVAILETYLLILGGYGGGLVVGTLKNWKILERPKSHYTGGELPRVTYTMEPLCEYHDSQSL